MPDIRKLPFKDLQLGMYVTEIVAQSKRVKMKVGGKINKSSHLERMKRQKVSFVYVDFNLSELVEQPETHVVNDKPDLTGEHVEFSYPLKIQTKKTPMKVELHHAEALFVETTAMQKKLFDSVKQDNSIELETLEGATNGIMESIFRNPEALLLITRLKDKNAYLFEHAVNSCILMTAFATYLDYNEDLIQKMAVGSFMHDIGKVLIPEAILNKTGKLTEEEFTEIQMHVGYGKKILNKISGISPVSIDIAFAHHERLDQSGYPGGNNQGDLPTWCRMLPIIDTYDAMTSERCYRQASTSVQAFRALMKAPNKYDNKLVQQFIKCVGVYPVGSLVKLKSGQLAMVYKANGDNSLKPLVVSFYNIEQRHHTIVETIDLAESANENIEKSVIPEEFNLTINSEFLSSLLLRV